MTIQKPSKAFYLASVVALLTGATAYLIGLLNAAMPLNEKGYYFAIFLFGLFSSVSLQKTVRDKAEGIPTTRIYLVLCWAGLGSAILLMVVGLVNANLLLSEKGFYAMAFVLSVFAAITVQKNVRDSQTTASMGRGSEANYVPASENEIEGAGRSERLDSSLANS